MRIKTLISPINLGANASPLQLKIDFCKRSNDWADFKPTTLAISGKDFLVIAEIIPKCNLSDAEEWLRGGFAHF